MDGEWVTPAGWHPEEEVVEEPATEGDVPFTGGLFDASRPLEVPSTSQTIRRTSKTV